MRSYLSGTIICKTGGKFIKEVLILIGIALVCAGTLEHATANEDYSASIQSSSLADAQLEPAAQADSQQMYTIHGPKGWNFKELSIENRSFVIFSSPKLEDQQRTVVFNENINAYVESTNLSFENYLAQLQAMLANQLKEFRLNDERDVTLSNLKGKVIVYTFAQGDLQLKAMQLFLMKDQTVYVATGTNWASEWDTDSDIIEASIMSLRPFDHDLSQPSTPDEWINRGEAFESDGKHEEALKAFDAALGLNPQCALAWKDKGNVLLGQGKYDEAIQAFDEAIRQNPNNVEAWNNKGLALYNQEKLDEANGCFDRAIELDPNYHAALKNKGLALKRQFTSMQENRNVLSSDPRWAAVGTGRMGRGF